MTDPIRQAEKADAAHLAELMVIAGDGIPLEVWRANAAEGQAPQAVGAARAAREAGAFSYRNAWVAGAEGAVRGMGFGYRLPDVPDPPPAPGTLPANVLPFLELEAVVPGSFYLNGLAVFPGWRGRGLGAGLMAEAFARARAQGCGRLSLTMFAGNAAAGRLYRSFDLVEIDRRPPLADPAHAHRGDILLLAVDLPA